MICIMYYDISRNDLGSRTILALPDKDILKLPTVWYGCVGKFPKQYETFILRITTVFFMNGDQIKQYIAM